MCIYRYLCAHLNQWILPGMAGSSNIETSQARHRSSTLVGTKAPPCDLQVMAAVVSETLWETKNQRNHGTKLANSRISMVKSTISMAKCMISMAKCMISMAKSTISTAIFKVAKLSVLPIPRISTPSSDWDRGHYNCSLDLLTWMIGCSWCVVVWRYLDYIMNQSLIVRTERVFLLVTIKCSLH